MYLEYRLIAEGYPGWSLLEIKQMPYQERQYWVQTIKQRKEV